MSAAKSLNPFEGIKRWEDDERHIIYLPKKMITDLEKRQDIYLVGSRGTGKTTFLKALNWDIRLTNRSILMQIQKKDLFEKEYIGIYVNALAFGDSIFERGDKKDVSLMLLYSLWAEVNVLYRIIESIEGLFNKGYFNFKVKTEEQQCNKIYDFLSNLFGDTILDKRSTTTIYNIPHLKEVVSELRDKIINENENLKHKCSSYSYGNLIEKTVPSLVCLCDENDKDNKSKWCIKICFDAIESAPNFHQIVNTLVAKKLSDRIWFIVSGLNNSNIETSQTYVPHHNLINDDREYIDLDKEFLLSNSAKSKEFYSFAEGICDLNLKCLDRSLDNNSIDSTKNFDLSKHLGSWTMNQILDTFLMSKKTLTVNKQFENFMQLVQENKEKNKYRTKFPPYIETYYYDVLKNAKNWEGDLQKSREKSSEMGKKYIVITLALLREYKLKDSTPYVGHRQIMSLCNSIRDFLKIMKALFNVRMKQPSFNLNDFFSYEAKLTKNEIKDQTEAVINVANDKLNDIENKYKNKAENLIMIDKMNIFIGTCGNILYDLQAKKEFSSLISEEKGIFTVSFKDSDDAKYMRQFLKTLADDTYIKILNENTKKKVVTVDFELSRLFAPIYKYSFRQTRQTKNKIRLDDKTLEKLCTCEANCEQIAENLRDDVISKYKITRIGQDTLF